MPETDYLRRYLADPEIISSNYGSVTQVSLVNSDLLVLNELSTDELKELVAFVKRGFK